MKRPVSNAFFIILVILLAIFMVANRDAVTVSFWPLPYLVETPLFFVFFAGLLLGIVLAWLVRFITRVSARLRTGEAKSGGSGPPGDKNGNG